MGEIMPLDHSKSKTAFVSNLKQELKTKPRDQALAIAYSIKRGRAEGGRVFHGPIVSSVPGRTDHHPMDVPAGCYVLPADHVSSLGEGNTLAGMEFIKKLGPHGIKKLIEKEGIHGHRLKPRKSGGAVGHPVPINAAGGEHVITPEDVSTIGDGDIDRGHSMLDAWVVKNRKKHIKTLSKLPGPAKD
jgi:hypothetical protein